MTQNDEEQFYLMVDDLLTIYGKESKGGVLRFWFSLMQEYSLDECRQAMAKYAKTVKYPPVPAGVIELIPGSAEISADEAWAHVPKLETDSGYMNQRMASSMGKALPLIDAGDMIAARMTFIAAYKNAPHDEEWFYSRGHGVSFEVAEQERVAQHLLLEDRGWVKPSEDINQLRLEQSKTPVLTDENRKRAAELKLLINGLTDSAGE